MKNYLLSGLILSSALIVHQLSARALPSDYFGIQIVDAETGRGVPLVELTTTSQQKFLTDSNGWVAINEPDLMQQNVYFSLSSHGYTMDADNFGYRGRAFDVKAGARAKIAIKRVNIAERLYRITGAGIYRDSVLLGEKVPIARPLINGGVTGQDTVMVTPYRDKLYWFWGDTNRFGYPLGNFATSGGTSALPAQGGLKPNVGMNLTYWTDESGFSKKMIPLSGNSGPVWVGGVFTLGQGAQQELYTHYAHLGKGDETTEQGLALFNDEKALFEKVLAFDGPLYPDGHPFRVNVDGVRYLYFQSSSLEAMPLVRVRADKASVMNPKAYQAFTPLKTGAQKDAGAQIERDKSGRLNYVWKSDTASWGPDARQKAVEAKQITAAEAPFTMRDILTDLPVQSHGGSVYWNAFRQKWVMISGQKFGSPSFLGELWFSEADTPTGPWIYARKIITHNKYTFYNPTQHPFFDENGGRRIYFEGTYVTTYSGNDNPTPFYDYNQIMYALDLTDARLDLPSPVYALANGEHAMRAQVLADKNWNQIQRAPFFAMMRASEKMVPVYQSAIFQLSTQKPNNNAAALFYALPATPAPDEKPAPSIVPLYVFRNGRNVRYSTDEKTRENETRDAQPLCRVWRNPTPTLTLDFSAQPLL